MSFYTDFPLYPTSVFSDANYPTQVDNIDIVYAKLINALKEEIQACFNELGTLPKGAYASVKARLDAIQAVVHNDLPGLQGGITDQYYHLSLQQHTELEALLKVILDLMEYTTNELAQAAYVSSDGGGYGPDICVDGTASASTTHEGFSPNNAFDDNLTTVWPTASPNTTGWIKYDLGNGITKKVVRYRILPQTDGLTLAPKNFTLQGSNNDSDWDTLDTQMDVVDWANGVWKTFTFTNSTAYRYYKIDVTVNNGGANHVVITEIEMKELSFNLQCYSEDTIKIQGNCSLKVVAVQTDSLNDTLTRTVDPPIDLSRKGIITLWARSNRTGENFKVEFHDSGGNTISYTVNVLIVSTWEEKEIDISGVADADKDSIDEIKYTILNADAAAEIYLDNNFAP